MPILRVIEGPDKGKELALNLKRGQLYCGNGKKITFRLKDEDVAEKHFRLVKDGNDLTIYNLDAENSLEVNDDNVEDEASLSIGDVIRLGSSVLEIAPPESKKVKKSNKSNKSKRGVKSSKSKVIKKKKLSPGTEIAGCEIQEIIGESSSFLVFKAIQKSLDRPVALKVLKPEIAEDKGAAEEFVSNARDAAKKAHDKLVQTYDVGKDSGYYYAINEFLPGGSLADVLERSGSLNKNELNELMRSITEAVQFIHSKKIFHGAIRPENILFNDDMEVKLSDLGVGGFGIDISSEMSRVHFIAPEIDLNELDLSCEAELYSIGVVIYEAACGNTLYSAEDIDDLREKQSSADFKPLKASSGLSKSSIVAVEKLLSPKPGDRFASVDEFVSALGDISDKKAKASRGKGRAAGYNSKVKSRSPSVSAAQIIKTKKQKAKENRNFKPIHFVIGAIVLSVLGVGVYIIHMPDPVQQAYIKADALIDEGKLEEALEVIKKTNKSWPSKYLSKLEDKENKLSDLLASKPEFEKINEEWNGYIKAKRSGGLGLTERKQKCISILARADKNAFAVEKKLTVAVKRELARIKKRGIIRVLEVTEENRGVLIDVKAQPGAKNNEISGLYGKSLKVRIQAPAEKCKANKAICKLLAKEFKLSKSAVEITGGQLNSHKRVLLAGLNKESFLKLLNGVVGSH